MSVSVTLGLSDFLFNEDTYLKKINVCIWHKTLSDNI